MQKTQTHTAGFEAWARPDRRLPLCGGLARRGAMLLEVIVSLALLVFGMSVIGYQINGSLDAARATDVGTRALMLVDTKLSELDAGFVRPAWSDDELRGYFGIAYPGYSWQMTVKPAEIQDFYLVKLEIGYNPAQGREQILNPELEIDIEDPGTRIVRTVYRLSPKPATIQPEDWGMSPEDLNEAASAAGPTDMGGGGLLPGGAGDGGGGGGGALPGGGGMGGGGGDQLQTLLKALTELLSTGGFDPNNIDPRELAGLLPPETMEQLGPFIDAFFGNGIGMDKLPGPFDNPAVRNLMNRNRGREGGRGPGRRGDRGENREGPGGREGREGREGRDGSDQEPPGMGADDEGPGDSRQGGDRPGRRPGRNRGDADNDRGPNGRGDQDMDSDDNGGQDNDAGGRPNRGGRGRDTGRDSGTDRGGRDRQGGDADRGPGPGRRGDRSGNNRDNNGDQDFGDDTDPGDSQDQNDRGAGRDRDDRPRRDGAGGRFGGSRGGGRGSGPNGGTSGGGRGGGGRTNQGSNRDN